MNIKVNETRGYIFEVDLEYPESLHDLHNGYPLALEKKILKILVNIMTFI